MRKTTIYLPDDLKERIERLASDGHRSEADVIRTALTEYTARERPRPTLPLVHGPRGTTDVAGGVDDLLRDGFGRR